MLFPGSADIEYHDSISGTFRPQPADQKHWISLVNFLQVTTSRSYCWNYRNFRVIFNPPDNLGMAFAKCMAAWEVLDLLQGEAER